jgi:membrane protein
VVLARLPRSKAQLKARTEQLKERIASSGVGRNRLVILLWRASKEMGRDDATHLAAGVAYYALFSLFPLILGLLALLGMVLQSESKQQEFLTFVADSLPGSAEFVEANLQAVIRARGALGLGAALGLFWSASAVFGAVALVVNRAFGIHRDRPFYIAKPRQLGMALGVGILFILSLAASSAIHWLSQSDLGLPGQAILKLGVVSVLLRIIPWAISFSLFLVLYKFLPNGKTYWRYVWPGAMAAGLLFELSNSLFVWYVGTFGNYAAVYGPLSGVIVLLFWAYVSSVILILGAEISSEYQKMHQPAAGTEGEDPEEREGADRA